MVCISSAYALHKRWLGLHMLRPAIGSPERAPANLRAWDRPELPFCERTGTRRGGITAATPQEWRCGGRQTASIGEVVGHIGERAIEVGYIGRASVQVADSSVRALPWTGSAFR